MILEKVVHYERQFSMLDRMMNKALKNDDIKQIQILTGEKYKLQEKYKEWLRNR